MSEEVEVDFEVIVIGGGVAGCVAAYTLAGQGHEVLLIERAMEPGSKNLSGWCFLLPSNGTGLPGLCK